MNRFGPKDRRVLCPNTSWEGCSETFKEFLLQDMTWLWSNRGAVTGSAVFPPLLKMLKGGENVTCEQPSVQPILLISEEL